MALKMGTQKQETVFKLIAWMGLTIADDSGNLQIVLHKAHSFKAEDIVYVSNLISSDDVNNEKPLYNGALSVLSVDGNSITLDLAYDATIYADEILVSDEFYLYGSMIYSHYMNHEYDRMIVAIDPDLVAPVGVSYGFTPGTSTFIITVEDAINRYASLRKARLAIETQLYSLTNSVCKGVGASVVDDVEYLEGVSPNGDVSIKLATAFKF